MAKKKTPVRKQPTRRQLARREKEYRTQRLMTYIAVGVGVVILAVLIYGFVTEVLIEARRPVAAIGDKTITTREFKSRQSYERWMTQLEIYQYQAYMTQISAQPADDESGMDSFLQQLQAQISSLETQLSPEYATLFGGQVLDTMIEEELIRQEAAERGMTVTDEQVRERIGQFLGYTDATTNITETTTLTETNTLTDTQPAMDYDELYLQFKTNVLDVTRFSEDSFRDMISAQILKQQLRSQLAADVSAVQEQVETIIYVAGTEETAQEIVTRLNDEGEDPDALVTELAADDDSVTSGFTLPWLPRDYLETQLSPEVASAAFSTPVGKASAPVAGQADSTYYVVYVLDHEERELSPDLQGYAEEQVYQAWLAEAKAERVEYFEWESAVITE